MTDLRDTAPQADGPDGAPSECSAPRRLLATATDRRLLPDEARVLDDWLAQAEGAVEQAAIAQRERDLAREERDRAQSDQALAEYDAKNERHRARTEHQWRQQSDQLCAELGKVLAQVAALVGAPGLEAEPEALLGRLAARLDQDSDSGRLLASVGVQLGAEFADGADGRSVYRAILRAIVGGLLERGQLEQELARAHDALRTILSLTLGVQVPLGGRLDPDAVVRQVARARRPERPCA